MKKKIAAILPEMKLAFREIGIGNYLTLAEQEVFPFCVTEDVEIIKNWAKQDIEIFVQGDIFYILTKEGTLLYMDSLQGKELHEYIKEYQHYLQFFLLFNQDIWEDNSDEAMLLLDRKSFVPAFCEEFGRRHS